MVRNKCNYPIPWFLGVFNIREEGLFDYPTVSQFPVWSLGGGERSSKPWVSGDVKLGLPRLRTFSESEMIERFSQRLELRTAHQ